MIYIYLFTYYTADVNSNNQKAPCVAIHMPFTKAIKTILLPLAVENRESHKDSSETKSL